MKVKDICTRAVRFCSLETTLAEAGGALWDGDCGVLLSGVAAPFGRLRAGRTCPSCPKLVEGLDRD